MIYFNLGLALFFWVSSSVEAKNGNNRTAMLSLFFSALNGALVMNELF